MAISNVVALAPGKVAQVGALQVASYTADPVGLADGTIWYRSDLEAFRMMVNGSAVSTTVTVTLAAVSTALGSTNAAAVTSTHAGAGNAGKLVKLDTNGALDGFAMQAAATITQTYATADATIHAMTATTPGAGADGTTPSGAQYAALVADVLALTKNVNKLVDILQANGICA